MQTNNKRHCCLLSLIYSISPYNIVKWVPSRFGYGFTWLRIFCMLCITASQFALHFLYLFLVLELTRLKQPTLQLCQDEIPPIILKRISA